MVKAATVKQNHIYAAPEWVMTTGVPPRGAASARWKIHSSSRTISHHQGQDSTGSAVGAGLGLGDFGSGGGADEMEVDFRVGGGTQRRPYRY
jgi:hypothetical protein